MNFSKLVRPTLVGLFACLFVISSQAQNKTINGKVTDAKDGSAMVGVSVTAKGTKVATQTGTDGTFRLAVPPSVTTLVVSSVGFGTQEINITNRTSVDVSMTATNEQLGEIVVVGYGTARKRDVTGSVVSVSAKDFNQGAAITAPDQLLQNKVAGLEVTNNTGQPGGATTVKIRGNSSIRANNNPLYVVDGVPLDGSTAAPNFGGLSSFGNTPGSNPLLYINPNDIAEISVLKDASSAAIYGSRGANGVIAITTKKASAGPAKLDFSTSLTMAAGYMKRYPILNASQFRTAITKYAQPATLDGGGNVDPLKEITQNSIGQNYNMSFSSGSETGKIRASFLASSAPGFIKRSGLDKYLASLGGTYKLLDKRLTIDFNLIAGTYTEDHAPLANNSGSTGNLLSSALSWNPTVPFFLSNGTYNLNANGLANPLAMSDAYHDRSEVNSYLGNISAAYKILDNLEYKFLYGVNHGVGQRRISEEGFLIGFPGLSGQGQAGIENLSLTTQIFTHTLTYRAKLGSNFNIDAVGGFEYYRSGQNGDGQGASGFNINLDQTTRLPILYTDIFQNAKTQNPRFTFNNPVTEIQSQFARASFNYQDKYVLTGTIRRDGSSKFGANNKYAYFPSVGFKWSIMNEGFMKDNKFFNNLGLRASYGLTGNQEFPSGSSQEQFGLNSYNAIGQNIVANPNLKWETTRSWNIGADFAFLKGKLYGTIDVYNKTTKDILFQTTSIQPAPNSSYFINLPSANLINKGFELSLGATVIDNPKTTWDVNLNYSYVKGVIRKFTDLNTGLPLKITTGTIDGQGVSGTLAQVITNDQPVNVYYLKPFSGFDGTGNQIIGGTPIYAGDPNPSSLIGLGTTVRVKKFSFTLNAGGAFGFMIYNNTATSVTNINGITSGRNIDLAAFNSAESASSGAAASTRFLEKGDYVKLRNLTVRYNLGSAGKYLKNASFFVTGSNLFVITGFKGFDPEVNIDKASGAYPSRSIEYIPYPTPRSISLGFNFTL